MPRSPFEGGHLPAAREVAEEELPLAGMEFPTFPQPIPTLSPVHVQNENEPLELGVAVQQQSDCDTGNGTVLDAILQLGLHAPLPGPVGGRLANHVKNWQKITSDAWVLQTVRGGLIPWETIPTHSFSAHQPRLSGPDFQALNAEITKLQEKNAVMPVVETSPQFVGSLFVRPKKDGGVRPIFNLKPLNAFVTYQHFKMEGWHTALDMIQPNVFMAKLDLKDAYLTVPMHRSVQRFLRFLWQGTLYQFLVCPFGLASAPWMFTKLMKPIISVLRSMAVRMVIYLDDMLLMHPDPKVLQDHVTTVVYLLERLGFHINWDKSVLSPTRQIEFLGFNLDSQSMKISLTTEKVMTIQTQCRELLTMTRISVRHLSQVLGRLVAAVRAVLPGPLQVRHLQMQRTKALLRGHHNYESEVVLSQECKTELRWWIEEIETWNGKSFIRPSPDLVIQLTTDASLIGWGAVCRGQTTQGRWSLEEGQMHINVLEMKAVLFALKAFLKEERNCHVHVRVDNTTTVANINKMGSPRSAMMLEITKELWQFCLCRGIMITAEHLPGILNTQADRASRHFADRSNWRLNPQLFNQLEKMWGPFSIDLFADRMNAQTRQFYSWKPDPEALGTDAFCHKWAPNTMYAFPPFCLIGRCLAKVRQDQAELILITPVWKGQPWYAELLTMTWECPILLPTTPSLLQGIAGEHHPLVIDQRLQLAAWRISGIDGKCKDFQQELWKSCSGQDERALNPHMSPLGSNGWAGAVNGIQIPFAPLWPIL